MSHTKEPWIFSDVEIDEYGFEEVFIGASDDGEIHGATFNEEQIAVVSGLNQDAKANARRIVACINACAGASTEYLEGFGIGVKITGISIDKVIEISNKERDTYRDLCAGLLEALKFVEKSNASNHVKYVILPAITKAESILGEKNGNAN